MANYTANGTYTLPNNGDYNATVDPNLTSVTFDLTNTSPATYSISSNTGSSVTVNASSDVITIVNLATNGGFLTLGPTVVNQLVSVNVNISDGGTAAVPGDLLNSLSGGSVTFGAGGGTDQVGTTGVNYNLSSPRIVYGFTSTADVVDDKSLSFGSFSSYVISGQNVSGQQTITFTAGSGSSLSFTVFGTNLTAGLYTTTGTGPLLVTNDGTGGSDISPNQVCFVRGTRIATPTGETAVEALDVGDLVSVIGVDGEAASQPIKWIGYRLIDLVGRSAPDTVAPVRIRKGAFAEGVPHSDLLVSPDHAIFVDGVLVSARQLVNYTTIQYEKNWRSVEYYHVELDHHAILIAEGLTVESYLDTGNRGFFINSGDPLVLRPDLATRSDFPTRETSSRAQFVWDEGTVQPVWQRLADRAAALGQKEAARDTTSNADLHILVDGRAIMPICIKEGLFTFVLPRKAMEVQVVSRASMPTDTRPWLDDRRRLGVSVERIVLRHKADVKEVPLDHPTLSRGWWDIERNGIAMRRWTNGAAVLPLPAFEGPAMLDLRASNGGMIYLLDAEQVGLAATA
jgi:hypothetical protein